MRATPLFLVVAALSCQSSGGTSPPSAAPVSPFGCSPGFLCFNIVPGGPGQLPPSRVVLVWMKPNEDPPHESAEIARLSGTERSLALPLSSIPPPRAAIDFAQSWGYIVVLPLQATDPLDSGSRVGAAHMMLVHTIGMGRFAHLFKEKFPNGMAEGTAPYFMQPDGIHDDFLLAPPGSVFELFICPSGGAPCRAKLPNPS